MIPNLRLRRLGASLLAAALMLGAQSAAAEDPMLVLRNAAIPDAEVTLSEADLLAMPQVTVRTRTSFTDGVVTFVGPLARDAVALIPVGPATTVHLVAANAYSYDIPLSDLTEFDVILAMSANGDRLSIRDKGPIWLMYPLDDHAELQEQRYNHRLVWQLVEMELR